MILIVNEVALKVALLQHTGWAGGWLVGWLVGWR